MSTEKYVRLTVMLPYHMLVFTVGETAEVRSQFSEDYKDYGKVTEIQDNSIEWETGIDYTYAIVFDTGKKIILESVPVQLDSGGAD